MSHRVVTLQSACCNMLMSCWNAFVCLWPTSEPSRVRPLSAPRPFLQPDMFGCCNFDCVVQTLDAGTSLSGTTIIFCTKCLQSHVLPFPLFRWTITKPLTVDWNALAGAAFKHDSPSGWVSHLSTDRRKCTWWNSLWKKGYKDWMFFWGGKKNQQASKGAVFLTKVIGTNSVTIISEKRFSLRLIAFIWQVTETAVTAGTHISEYTTDASAWC